MSGNLNPLPAYTNLVSGSVFSLICKGVCPTFELSAYVKQNDKNNYLLTDTRKYDVTNYWLRPNRNNKWEGGVDLSFEGYQLSLTVFSEKSKCGFGSITNYHPVSYLRYMDPNTSYVGRRSIC